MKSAPFEYLAPGSLEEAVAHLALASEAKALAGGQSLIPLLNLRLATPDTLVDLGRLDELRGISATPSGGVAIGAMTTHQEVLEADAAVLGGWTQTLRETLGCIAHPQIRHRGTVGGSIAHADPAAEWATLCVLAEATIVCEGPNGRRNLPADGFFQGSLTTLLDFAELVVRVELPPVGRRAAASFVEFARRPGDFGVVLVGCRAVRPRLGAARLRFVFGGLSGRPQVAECRAPRSLLRNDGRPDPEISTLVQSLHIRPDDTTDRGRKERLAAACATQAALVALERSRVA